MAADNFPYTDPGAKPEKIMLEDVYRPPDETREFIYKVYDKYIKWRSLRDQTYKQFNSMNMLQYVQDARQKFWGYTPLSFDVDTPQFFFPETRNQIISILAKISNLRLNPTFDGIEGFDIIKATLLQDLFDYWSRNSNRKLENFWQFLYNVINGTVIVFTAYNSRVHDVKSITYHDPVSGKTRYKTSEKDESDVKETIVNLEDFYFPKLWEPNVQEQEEVIWRTLMKWSDFKDAFRGYSNIDVVFPGSQFADASIFQDFLSYDVRGSDFIEVIKYFNVPNDQYAVIANGVLLNPLQTKEGEEIAPLPWNHKKLPFSKTIFEPIDTNFFYGMPLAQKVKSPQEALNMMWELMLERERRSVAAPIITNDPSVEFGLEFKPGRVYQVQGDISQYKELSVSGASQSYWNAMTTLDGIIQRTGSGGSGPAMPGSRQPVSASENAAIQNEKKAAEGLYYMFYKDLLEQKVWLILKNMIQFYTTHKVKKILGKKQYNRIIALTDVKLFGGGLGNREIRITSKPASGAELQKESYMRSLIKKERVEIIEVTPQALQELEFDIKIDFETENSPADERALYLDFLKTVFGLFGQAGIVSPKKAFFRLVEKFNENITDLVDDNVLAEYDSDRFEKPKPPQPPQAGAPGAPQVPGGNPPQASPINTAKQSVLGRRVGAQGPMSAVK